MSKSVIVCTFSSHAFFSNDTYLLQDIVGSIIAAWLMHTPAPYSIHPGVRTYLDLQRFLNAAYLLAGILYV